MIHDIGFDRLIPLPTILTSFLTNVRFCSLVNSDKERSILITKHLRDTLHLCPITDYIENVGADKDICTGKAITLIRVISIPIRIPIWVITNIFDVFTLKEISDNFRITTTPPIINNQRSTESLTIAKGVFTPNLVIFQLTPINMIVDTGKFGAINGCELRSDRLIFHNLDSFQS
jgi:hypothetical protein